eukprot:519318-Pleurochrysis_carterae.AAC.1
MRNPVCDAVLRLPPREVLLWLCSDVYTELQLPSIPSVCQLLPTLPLSDFEIAKDLACYMLPHEPEVVKQFFLDFTANCLRSGVSSCLK